MRALLRFSQAVDTVNRRLARAAGVPLVALIAVGSYNAIAGSLQQRLDLRLTSNALLELQWYLFSLVFLFGAAHTLRSGGHVRVDVLSSGLPARGRRWIDCLGSFLFVVPFGVFATWVAIPFAFESIVRNEGSGDPGGLLRWPLKLMVPVAFASIALQGFADGVRHLAVLRGFRSDDEDDDGA